MNNVSRLPDCVPEREVPPAHRARDPETEGAGRGAQPGAEGVEGEAPTQEEGAALVLTHMDFENFSDKPNNLP